MNKFLQSIWPMLTVQICACVVTALVPIQMRPFILLAGMVASTLICIVCRKAEKRGHAIAGMIASTAIILGTIWGMRQNSNLIDLLGPVPSALEVISLGILGTGVVVLGAIAIFLSTSRSFGFRFRWPVISVFILLTAVIAYLGATYRRDSTPSDLLNRLVQLETDRDHLQSFELQELRFYLGVLGRHADIRTVPTHRDEHRLPPPQEPLRVLSKNAKDWQTAITDVAASHRIVIIMEAHDSPAHREWIQQTLPFFREAGFDHYAAEALGERGAVLRERSYPTTGTGYYTREPRFGNLLREAIRLGFQLHEYEAVLKTGQEREAGQAEALAKIIGSQPDSKVLIHAGYAHIFKTPHKDGQRWMAARLWELTGIEPYCIYQSTEAVDSHNFHQLVSDLEVVTGPKILSPLPSGFTDRQLAGIPDGAIDALVVHPLCKQKPPHDRTPVFPERMNSIEGNWNHTWPVVIAAYAKNERDDGVPLDMVLLRQGESNYQLWTIESEPRLKVFSIEGEIPFP